jgi:uncharacterized protein YjcR
MTNEQPISLNGESIKKFYDAGLPDYIIANILGINASDVSNWRENNKLPNKKINCKNPFNILANSFDKPRNRKCSRYTRIDKINRDLVKSLYHSGYNDDALAFIIGVCSSTVRGWRKRNGLPPVNNITLSMAREQDKFYRIAHQDAHETQEDPESLYYCTDTLVKVCGKDIDDTN